jgi:hypothetical protein
MQLQAALKTMNLKAVFHFLQYISLGPAKLENIP